MSAGAGTAPSGASASGAPGRPARAGAGSSAGRAATAGEFLGRLSLVPVLLATAWLLAGLPLLLAGRFTPVPTLVLAVPVAAVLLYLGLRRTPGRWPGGLPSPAPEAAATPWWAAGGVVAVAAAFAVYQLIYRSQQIIVMRDPASYLQFAAWLAHHGSLPIPQSRAAFGAAAGALKFASPAFFQVGHSVVPQFMAGLPMVLAGGFWIGGVSAAAALGPLLGAGAVLTFGGLAARLTGARWAPLAALVLAICMPEQFTSRSTYTEPLAQILFLGGLCLVVDALQAKRSRGAVTAAIGGLALGITVLVRIDGISDILPVIPYCGLLYAARRREGLPLLGGLAAGGALGLAEGVLLSRPYLHLLSSSLVPLALVVALALIGTAVGVAVVQQRGTPALPGWVLIVAGLLPAAALAVFTVRAYLVHVYRPGHLPFHLLQHTSGLSMRWVFWYLGVPAVLLGVLGAGLLARRCLRGQAPEWVLPLLAFGWIIVTVLYRPAITPDQPWASRRLVPGVLPGLILLGVWALAWLAAWLRQRGLAQPARSGLVTACAIALALPAAVATFGLGLTVGGPAGTGLTADGVGFKTTYAGEIAAVNRLCAAIPRGSAVVIVNSRAARRFTEVVRGMCGDPAASVRNSQPASVSNIVRAIRRSGHRPVLLAEQRSELLPYGGPSKQIMALQTTADASTLTGAPRDTPSLQILLWLSEPTS